MPVRLGCFPRVVALALMLILPWILFDLLNAALLKLRLEHSTAAILVAGILIGSIINIPIKRIKRAESVPVDSVALFGRGGLQRGFEQLRTDTVVAVNVGGCVIPASLAGY